MKSDELFIKHYYELIIEYYENNIGNKSEITGAIITENMCKISRIRFFELYGYWH
jgi:hypothetical protein